MTEHSTFDAYGERFRFEPPVEVSERVVDSLGKLAAIASLGAGGNDTLIDLYSEQVDFLLKQNFQLTGVKKFEKMLTEFSSKRDTHVVTIE